jgi:hypothetical protein
MREAMARLGHGGSVEVALRVIHGNRQAVGSYEWLRIGMDGAIRIRVRYGKPPAILRLRRLLEESM